MSNDLQITQDDLDFVAAWIRAVLRGSLEIYNGDYLTGTDILTPEEFRRLDQLQARIAILSRQV